MQPQTDEKGAAAVSVRKRSRLSDWYEVVQKSRVSIIGLLVVAGAFALAAQAQDVLRSLAQKGNGCQIVSFEPLLLTWAIFLWYAARFLLDQDFEAMRRGIDSDQNTRTLWGEEFMPRFLGAAGLACVGAAMLKAVHGMPSTVDIHYGRLRVLGYANIVLAAALYFFLKHRHAIMDYSSRMLRQVSNNDALNQALTYTRRTQRVASFSGFPAWLRWFLVAAVIASLVIWAVIFISLQTMSLRFGTATILVLGFIFITIYATLLAWWGERCRLPLILLAVLYAGVVGMFNDNHAVRRLDTQARRHPDLTAEKLYTTWLEAMDKEYGVKNRPHPMFIVAASGGGIKAAYWTASVLSNLQDHHDGFAKHAIVISPVSGGALGALVFTNLVVEAPRTKLNYLGLSRSILRRDFLSPTVGSLLFHDLPARFVPFPNLVPDRAEALEKAWERAWDPAHNKDLPVELSPWKEKNPFKKGFSDHTDYERDHVIPTLLINGTSVETGQRILTTHLITDFPFMDCKNFFDMQQRDIRMSTAALMSARFTYVSPAGTINGYNRVVDGGYFENSGSATAMQFYERIEQFIDRDRKKNIVTPVFIQIDNNYVDLDKGKQEKKNKERPSEMFPEIQAPISAMLKTREAHGSSIEMRTFNTFGENYYLYTFCSAESVQAPLGWYLSDAAQRELDNQLLNNDTCNLAMKGNDVNTREILEKLPKKKNDLAQSKQRR